MPYATPPGGLPDQTGRPHDRAVFTTAYAVIPASVMRDIVTSFLPGWTDCRAWIIARPMTGFAETFAWLIVEIAAGGGSDRPEPDPDGQGVVFVSKGRLTLTLDGKTHEMDEGGYAYLPAGADWRVRSDGGATIHWVRKAWEPADGIAPPAAFVTHETAADPVPMPGTDGAWATRRFADPADLAHDMHVNLVSFRPGATIPFAETHVMEHGLYVIEGHAAYLLNDTWVEVEPGDFLWLRAFCPQACIARGPGPFRYLLYKDVNRHPKLRLPG